MIPFRTKQKYPLPKSPPPPPPPPPKKNKQKTNKQKTKKQLRALSGDVNDLHVVFRF